MSTLLQWDEDRAAYRSDDILVAAPKIQALAYSLARAIAKTVVGRTATDVERLTQAYYEARKIEYWNGTKMPQLLAQETPSPKDAVSSIDLTEYVTILKQVEPGKRAIIGLTGDDEKRSTKRRFTAAAKKLGKPIKWITSVETDSRIAFIFDTKKEVKNAQAK